MTADDIKTFLKQLKYDRKYAQDKILCNEWYDLVHDIFWNKPYRLLYTPQQLTKYTEFIEFLDGNGFRIKPIVHIDENIVVEIVLE